MAAGDHNSVEARVAAPEERFAKLDETRRSVIPDEVWNKPEFQAYRDRNARNAFQCMLQNVTDASEQIEAARVQAAEKRAIEDQRKAAEEQQVRQVAATFEVATEQQVRDGATLEEARILAAIECYENFRSVPPGYQVEQKPEGGFIIRAGYVV
jgi:hypothetical protein